MQREPVTRIDGETRYSNSNCKRSGGGIADKDCNGVNEASRMRVCQHPTNHTCVVEVVPASGRSVTRGRYTNQHRHHDLMTL